MKASNNSKYVNLIIRCKYILIALLLILIPVAYAGLSGSLSVDAITKRLQPMAQVNVAGADAAAAEDGAAVAGVGSPKDIYKNNCEMCHAVGLAGAPRMGNKADWAPRVSQGLDTMVKHAWEGIRAMPPKGNCLQCTEADIRATVQYMVDSLK